MTQRDTVSVLVRTSDRTRAAEVNVPRLMTVTDILNASRDNWKLPGDVEYQLVNLRTGKQLLPDARLGADQVADGDELVVNPMLLAGGE
jgi:hypothetical protein